MNKLEPRVNLFEFVDVDDLEASSSDTELRDRSFLVLYDGKELKEETIWKLIAQIRSGVPMKVTGLTRTRSQNASELPSNNNIHVQH
jgi:hypothetical protein